MYMTQLTASQRIADKLRAIGVTQSAVARTLGLTQSNVSRRFSGRVPFTVDQLDALADYLHLEPEDLIGRRQQADRS